MAQPSVQGRLIWQELVTDDPAAVTPFYEKVLSWRAQPAASDPAYTNFAVARSGPIAGATKPTAEARARGAAPHWLLYIGVADVDAALATAVRLGAKVLQGAADIDVGRFAVLSDPQGATFAIYKPHEAKPAPTGVPAPGEFVWLELATSDFDAALKFYQEVYGWQLIERMDMGPRGFYLIFGNDGVQRGGIYKLPPSAPHPYWIAYIEVADVEKTIAVTTKSGGKLLTGPHTVPGGGRIAQLIDPAGVVFAVHTQPKVPVVTPPAPAPTAATVSEAPKPPAPKKSSPAPKPAAATAAPAAPVAPIAKTPAPVTPAAKAPAPAAPVAKAPAPATPPAAAPTPAPAPAPGPAPGPAKSVAKKAPTKQKAAKKVAKKAPTPAVKPVAAPAAKKAAKRSVKKAAKKAAKKAVKKAAKKAAKKAPAKKKKVAVRLSAPARKTVKPAARKAPKEDKKKKDKKKDKKKRKKDKARRKK